MLPNINITKRYRIHLHEQSKARMKLTSNLIHALIYFYPEGHSKKSKKGYNASDVQIDILSPEFKENGECVKIIWKCGNEIKQQHCSLSRYIKPDNKRVLGFHTLFKISDIQKMKQIIKVTVIINKKCTKIITNCILKQTNNNNNNNKRKFIQTKLNDYKFINHSNKKRKLNATLQDDWKYHWKLNSSIMKNIVLKISEKLNMNDLFGILPTIDCFCNDKNQQSYCREKITETDNFFDKKYDSLSIIDWQKHVAWCNPPPHRNTIISTINIFEKRKMKGFVCIAYWNNCPWMKERWWGRCKLKCKTYITIKQGIPFHGLLVLFFDFNIIKIYD